MLDSRHPLPPQDYVLHAKAFRNYIYEMILDSYVCTVQSNYNFTLPCIITLISVFNPQRAPVCHGLILCGTRPRPSPT